MKHSIRRINYNLIFVKKTREIVASVILDILDYVDVDYIFDYIFDYSIQGVPKKTEPAKN